MRDADPDGVVIEGIRMARNALLHGAALCAEVRPDVQLPGMTIGPWAWSSDIANLVGSLDIPPSAEQRASYERHISGELLAGPMGRAKKWFETAQSNWPL
jgi:hypothetical protein